MARAVKEWTGKTPDTKAPPRVRQRVFDRHEGVCHICKLPIKPGETWHLDHVIALIEGGENKESNLAPAHAHCNLAKAAQESARKSKVNRTRQKHIGAVKPKGRIQSRGFGKKERTEKLPLPPARSIYRSIEK
ncbi:HNH endonuclease [Oricola thermophila]|uniref:HNH endonuclease n=1 Tax=Oricola thermophila TaxID=2742145 RepID=A0A6N1VAY7_9HYPH|nr:HNH endonuclease signature motif containing protein [Oricola thermophila]QKV17818.1 HNH endonuclease [Oricola thermophila]